MNYPAEKIIDIRELRIGNLLKYEDKIVHVTMLSRDIDDEYEEQICFCELGKTTDEKGGFWFLGNRLLYVHQLQNLYFALTSNELSIH